jgi:hypothetical protein
MSTCAASVLLPHLELMWPISIYWSGGEAVKRMDNLADHVRPRLLLHATTGGARRSRRDRQGPSLQFLRNNTYLAGENSTASAAGAARWTGLKAFTRVTDLRPRRLLRRPPLRVVGHRDAPPSLRGSSPSACRDDRLQNSVIVGAEGPFVNADIPPEGLQESRLQRMDLLQVVKEAKLQEVHVPPGRQSCRQVQLTRREGGQCAVRLKQR